MAYFMNPTETNILELKMVTFDSKLKCFSNDFVETFFNAQHLDSLHIDNFGDVYLTDDLYDLVRQAQAWEEGRDDIAVFDNYAETLKQHNGELFDGLRSVKAVMYGVKVQAEIMSSTLLAF